MLKLGRGGELPRPWSPTKPHTFPRYAPKRVTTALQVKVRRPKEAVCVSCPRPCHKIVELWHELAGIAVAVRIFIQFSTSCISHQQKVIVRKRAQLVLVSILFNNSLTHKPAVSNN